MQNLRQFFGWTQKVFDNYDQCNALAVCLTLNVGSRTCKVPPLYFRWSVWPLIYGSGSLTFMNDDNTNFAIVLYLLSYSGK